MAVQRAQRLEGRQVGSKVDQWVEWVPMLVGKLELRKVATMAATMVDLLVSLWVT